MIVLLSLALQIVGSGPAALALTGTVALPFRAETAAWAVAVGDELRLFVNRPDAGETAQLSVRSSPAGSGPRMAELTPLPLVMAGAVRCGHEIVVTGSDRSGRPVALVLDGAGKPARRFTMDETHPIVWPVPVCQPEPGVLWQAVPKRIEIAEIGANGLGRPRSEPVGDGPLGLASVGGKTWIVWAEVDAVRGLEIGPGATVRPVRVPAARARGVAVGACGDGVCLSYEEGRSTVMVRLPAPDKPGHPVVLDPGRAAGGLLTVVAGIEPWVWAQRMTSQEPEKPRWITALMSPGQAPVLIEGMIHAVTWWNQHIVAVGADGIYLFRPTADGGGRSRRKGEER